MILSLMRRSKHQHTYLTFEASQRRRDEFKYLNLELVEIGEDEQKAVDFINQNADILHASFSGGPEPGMFFGCKANKPIVLSCQAPNIPLTPGEAKDCHIHIIPVSRGILEYWPQDYQYDRVIYSCAEPIPECDKQKAKAHFGFNPEKPVVGRVGRLEGMKRPEDFVFIARQIWNQVPGYVQFLLVGEGSDGDGIRYAVRREKIPVVMPGYLTGVDKILAYNAIDVFLYPTSVEGFGIVFAEAMSLGIPIVTYSDPVNVDVVGAAGVFGVDNLYTGIENPWFSMASLTLDLLRNQREWNKLHQNGLRRYKQRYTPERMVQEFDQLYEEIINETV